MKKFLLIIVVFSNTVFSQEQKKLEPTSKRTEEYCLILASSKLFSTKVDISIDFGQETKLFSDSRYKDQEGKVKVFNSVIDALNYMNSKGWEFVNAYAISIQGSGQVYHYLMKRKI